MVDDREQAPMDRRRGVLGLLSMALIEVALGGRALLAVWQNHRKKRARNAIPKKKGN